jgi:hypothetical protein
MKNKKESDITRMVVISDIHSGSLMGLTPPEFQTGLINKDISKNNKSAQIQRELWSFYSSEIDSLKKDNPIDILVANGDCIEGDGSRSGGTELICVDRIKQCEIAKEVISYAEAKTYLLTYGTQYHTGADGEDYEELIAKDLKAKIGSHEWIEIRGNIFDFKHHIGTSNSPIGRYTPLAKEAIWNKLWSERQLIPSGVNNKQFIIRSHVHYFSMISDGDFTALTTPCLQGFGTKYGARRCSGVIDIGFLHFDIDKSGNVSMHKHFAKIKSQVTHPSIKI